MKENDPERLVHQLVMLQKLMIGLCIVLAFTLGFNILQWNTNGRQDAKIREQAGIINGIQNANHLAAKAAQASCRANAPRNNELIRDLADYFSNQAKVLKPLLDATPKGSNEYKTRESSYKNYRAISKDLYSFLPLKCSKPGNPPKTRHSG